MSDLARAIDAMGKLPDNVLIHLKHVDRWKFVGRVSAPLCYERKDGEPLTEEDVHTIRQHGPRLAGVKSRSFETREDALRALADLENDS